MNKSFNVNYVLERLGLILSALALFVGMQNINCATCALDSTPVVNLPIDSPYTPALQNFTNAKPYSNSATLFNTVSKMLSTAGSLDYFKDKSASIDVNGFKVILDWGFSGSGDIFEPLGGIKCNFNFSANDNAEQISTAALVKALAFNHLKKKLGEKDEFKWISDFKFTPIHLLGLKLMLLFKTLNTDEGKSHFFTEIASLLCRLSLVDDLSIIDKNKQLTSYLPEEINETLQDMGLGLPEFVDQIWTAIINNKTISPDLSLKNPVRLECFVFTKKDLADVAFKKFEKYSGNNFCQDFENFGSNGGAFQITDQSQFKKMTGPISSDYMFANPGLNPFSDNIVTLKELIIDDNASTGTQFEEELRKKIKPLNGKDGVIFVEDSSTHTFWVIQVCKDLGVIGATKCLAFVFARAFKEYVKAKKALYEGNDAESIKYRALVKARQDLRDSLELFVNSKEGAPIFDEICRQVNALIGTTVSEETRKILQETRGKLEKEIAALEQKQAQNTKLYGLGMIPADNQNLTDTKIKLEKEIAALKLKQAQPTKTHYFGIIPHFTKPKATIATEDAAILKQISDKEAELAQITKKTKDADDLREQIDTKRADLTRIEIQLSNVNAYDELRQEENELEQLKKIVKEQEISGKAVDPEILKIVGDLEKKIQHDRAVKVSINTLQDKLFAREKIAQMLEVAAKQLHANSQNQENSGDILGERIRRVQELLSKNSKPSKEKFATRLEEFAKEIRENSNKAERLTELRATNQISTERDILELEVGHILDSTHENFIGDLMLRSTIFKDFIKDVTTAGNTDVVKRMIMESVGRILEGSQTVQDNAIIIKYFMQYVPSSAKALLKISGATQLVQA